MLSIQLKNILIIGSSGTGKTILIKNFKNNLNANKWLKLSLLLSIKTTN